MRTAIFTNRSNTPLNIVISENENKVRLVQMGRETEPLELTCGSNAVTLGFGVFRIFSQHGVAVAVTEPEFTAWVASTAKDKDGSFPDTARLADVNHAEVAKFFVVADAKSED